MSSAEINTQEERLPWLRIGQYPPILDQQDNSFLSNNASFVLAFEMELPEIYSLAKEDFSSLLNTWESALKHLPSGTIIHKQDYYFQEAFDIEKLPQRSFLEKATAEHFQKRTFLSHRTLLFFSWAQINTLESFQLKFALKKINLLEVLGQEEFINESFISEVSKAIDYLNTSSFFSIKPLMDEEIFQASSKYLNLREDKITCSGLFNLKEKKEGLNISMKIGHEAVGMYALNSEREFPESLIASKKDPLYSSNSFCFFKGLGDHFGLSLPFSHIYNQILILDDPKYWVTQLEKKAASLIKLQRFSSELRFDYERINKILTHRYTNPEGSPLIRAHFNVIFWDDNLNSFKEKSNILSSTFKSLDSNAKSIEGKELGHLFLNSHFANVANFSNHHLSVLPLDTALCLFTNVTNYKSDSSGIFLHDRLTNIPLKKDVWDASKKRIKARNFALFAPTGEGKSVLANHLIRQFLDQGYKVVIIDLGGSYEKLCHLYSENSIYLKFENNTPLSINLFALDTIEELTPFKLESLSSFVFLHIKRETKPTQIQKVILKKILVLYYKRVFEKKTDPSFLDFVDFVNTNPKALSEQGEFSLSQFDFSEFFILTSEFRKDGSYHFLYDHSTYKSDMLGNKDSDQNNYKRNPKGGIKNKSLIVAELDAIKDNPVILSIYLHMIHEVIDQNIWQDKTQKGIVLYDEFAKSLQFENVLNQVIYYAQAIRKQNGALGIILQSINQLPDKQELRAMIENIQVIYSLKNQGGYKDLVSRLNLNEHQHYQLQSLRNNFSGKRKYSEFWLRLGNQSNVYRLELPAKALYAYLSEGEENEQILDLFKETGDMQKAICQYETLQNQSPMI